MSRNRTGLMTRTWAAPLLLLLLLTLSLGVSVSAQSIVWKATAGKAVAFSPDGQALLAGTQLRRVSDGALLLNFRLPYNGNGPNAVALSPDGQILAAGSNAIDQYGDCTDCTVKLWRISDGALLRTIKGGNDGITSVAFSPNQKQIAGGSGDRVYMGVVRIWRVTDGALLKRFYQDQNNPSSYVTSVAYSPDGLFLAYARSDLLTVMARNPFSPY